MLTETDRILISGRHRNFPLVCGFMELPGPVARPPQGTGTTPFTFWCTDPALSIAQAFSGEVFTDGSCFKDGPCTYHAAGWSVIKLTPAGELFAALWGAVGSAYPRTSPAAEHVAVLAVMEHCPEVSLIYSDFLGLVKMSEAPWHSVASRQHFYAGLAIQIRGSPNWDAGFRIVKVPAHVDPESLPQLSPGWYRAIGNELADRYAKKGALSLPQPSEAEKESWTEESATLRRYLLYAVQALLLFPRLAPSKAMRSIFDKSLREEGFITGIGAARQALPAPPPPTLPPPRPDPPLVPDRRPRGPIREHCWVWKHSRWVCRVCLTFARGANKPAPSSSPCRGHSEAFTQLVQNPRKHVLHISNYPLGVIFICSTCGAYSESGNLRGLGRDCNLKFTSHGARHSWQRFCRRQHPNSKRGPAHCLEEFMPISALLQS